MADGQIIFHLPRPPAEVWTLIGDLERAPEWVPDLVSVTKITPGEIAVGTRYAEVVRIAGKEGHAELEVTRFEPPRYFAHEGQGPSIEFAATFLLEEEGGGTKITHDYTVRLAGLMRMMEPMVKSWVKKSVEESVEILTQRFDDAALDGSEGG